MGVVGEGILQADTIQEASDQTPQTVSHHTVEGGITPRLADLAQPFDRGKSGQLISLSEFYTLFAKTLSYARENAGMAYDIKYSKEFPPDELELPCFTTKLISRRPASFKGVSEFGWRPIQEVPDLENPGTTVEIGMRRQENIVKLTIWTKDAKHLDPLAEWVEEVFYEYLWVLEWYGTSRPILWMGRDEDEVKEVRGQIIHGAPIRFKVITEKHQVARRTNLRSLRVTLGIIPQDTST